MADGNQLEKRSTAAVGPVVSSTPLPLPSASASALPPLPGGFTQIPIPIPIPIIPISKSKNKSREKEIGKEKEWSSDSTKDREADAMGRSPCWMGLDNGERRKEQAMVLFELLNCVVLSRIESIIQPSRVLSQAGALQLQGWLPKLWGIGGPSTRHACNFDMEKDANRSARPKHVAH